jgi:hypothetical protein
MPPSYLLCLYLYHLLDVSNRTISESLHVLIISTDLAGLAAAVVTKIANLEHRVATLESVKELAEIWVRATIPFFFYAFNPISVTVFHLLFALQADSGRITGGLQLTSKPL